MTTYYNIQLTSNIAHGSDILDKPCSVCFTYPGGSRSHTYDGKILAWPTQSSVRMSSPVLNIDSAWNGANGGTLRIASAGGLSYGIAGFSKMADQLDGTRRGHPNLGPGAGFSAFRPALRRESRPAPHRR